MGTSSVLRAAWLGASAGLALLAGCGQKSAFYDSGARISVSTVVGTDPQSGNAVAAGQDQTTGTTAPAASDGTSVATASTATGTDAKVDYTNPDGSAGRELVHSLTESLALGTTQNIVEPPVAIPAEPLATLQCPAQSLTPTTGTPSPATVSGATASLRTQTFSKLAPTQKLTAPDALAAAGKPVDVYLIIDNTEGLLDFAPLQQRALTAVTNLLTQVYATDWRLYVGGIVAGSGSAQLTAAFLKTNANGSIAYSLNDVATTIPNQIVAGIYRNVANDDAELFRSLSQLHTAYSARTGAVVANFIVSNAANCKVTQVNANGNTTLWSKNCNATAGNPDYFDYLVSNNGGATGYRNAMNLFGAMYQMNANPSICGSFHVPENDATFTGGSQYAALAAHLETINYPELTPLAPASWVGDLCADTPDWSFLTRFGGAILDEATHRFIVSDANSIYDLSSFGFPNQVLQDVGGQPGAALASTQVQLIGAPVNPETVKAMTVRVTDATLDGQSVQAEYYQDNGFRTSSFTLSLTPDPSQPVTVTWAPNGSLSCAAAAGANPTFTANGPQCQYYGTTLYLASMSVLPPVSPGATLPFTVSYTNLVQEVTSLTMTAASPLLGAPYDQLTLYVTTGGGGPQPVAAAVFAVPNGSPTTRVITLPGNAPFPAGTYSVKYFEQSDTNSECDLPATAVVATDLSPQVVCALPSGTAYPCAFASNRVTYSGVLTANPGDANTNHLVVTYHTAVAAEAQFTLQKVPDDGSLQIQISAANEPTITLKATDYTLNGKDLALATPLAPGETMSVAYTVTVPLSAVNCLQLSAVAVDGKYTVEYGPTGEPAPLDAAKYTLSFPNGSSKPGLVCLAPGVADYNHALVVSYTDKDVISGT